MYDLEKDCKAMIEALKEICKQKNMTPYAVAKKAGISSSTMSYIINGKTKPQISTLMMMCDVLEVPITRLFEEVEIASCAEPEAQLPEMTNEEKELIQTCRTLSEKKKKLLKMYLDALADV